MALRPDIILGARQPDIIGQMARGASAVQGINAVGRENRLMQLYNEAGPQIAAGDQNALARLAQMSPQASLGIQQTRQGMALDAERLKQIRVQAANAAQDRIDERNAAQVAAETEQAKRVVSMALADPENADKYLASNEQTRQYVGTPIEAVGAAILGIEDVVKMRGKGDFRRATPDEAAQYGAQAGQFGPDGKFYPIQPPKGMQITSDGAGGFTFTEGAGVGGTTPEAMNPKSTGAMIDSIDGILNDPALNRATGALSVLQSVPGTEMYRFGTRVRQLQGQAFLQAFESLKGAGQITEIEGQKATEAIGRLDSAQAPDDYRQALQELRGVLVDAMERPRGWSDTTAGKIAVMSARQIGEMDLSKLTPEELQAARQRLLEIKRQTQ